MLFHSTEFIFLFLPAAFFVYFFLNGYRLTTAASSWLVLCSLFFYGWWNVMYVPLILVSVIFNYATGSALERRGMSANGRKTLLAFGAGANLLLLGYFKYADFFIGNVNHLTGAGIPLLNLALPLAISFFTFQQIAYLVDTYRGAVREHDFIRYALFVTFFPQLIAGPIVHHAEMMPQFAALRNKALNHRNIAAGLFIFVIGLAKKVVIADTFSIWATHGFDHAVTLNFVEAWVTSLSYTFQIYFDFSGYTDMATGAALLFNIRLPVNFNSPYKALDIRDFWRRWHMTLSRFLRDYVYIPLGGARTGEMKTVRNLMATFLLGGLWHGAGWTFILWGFLHGAALIIHRLWTGAGFRLPRAAAWLLTFGFVNASWVFFRAVAMDDAWKVLKGMAGLNGVMLHPALERVFPSLAGAGVTFGGWVEHMQRSADPGDPMNSARTMAFSLAVALALALAAKNSTALMRRFSPSWRTLLMAAALFLSYTLFEFYFKVEHEFIYFEF